MIRDEVWVGEREGMVISLRDSWKVKMSDVHVDYFSKRLPVDFTNVEAPVCFIIF
jgi:hypothetical protein